MRIKILSVTLLIILVCIIDKNAYSWKPDRTHADFSRYAAENSVLDVTKGDYLKNIGFKKGFDDEKLELDGIQLSIRDWLAYGSEKEDSATLWDQCCGQARYENHFHNPLKPWINAGLDDIATGWSSVIWAQDSTEQASYTEGDWSWKRIRDVYYWALTDTTEASRQVNFAQTFKGLGHQMHLIQDAAQPEHARNDTHVGDRNKMGHLTFEAWTHRRAT